MQVAGTGIDWRKAQVMTVPMRVRIVEAGTAQLCVDPLDVGEDEPSHSDSDNTPSEHFRRQLARVLRSINFVLIAVHP